MSKITRCHECAGNIVEPAYDGDGAYPVGHMCTCKSSGDTPPTDNDDRHPLGYTSVRYADEMPESDFYGE
jgi:hypothetical protein